jgi:hypothetical protein
MQSGPIRFNANGSEHFFHFISQSLITIMVKFLLAGNYLAIGIPLPMRD